MSGLFRATPDQAHLIAFESATCQNQILISPDYVYEYVNKSK